MEISPDKMNIDTIFGNTTYYIDFYQRQYKWEKDPVNKLLDDIFYKFNSEYNEHRNSDIEVPKLIEQYRWYYLNTYVTNAVDGKDYVVDGQQRLTTLSLILIKLRHMARAFNSQLEGWIDNKIAGNSGYKKNFWMNHLNSINTLSALYKNGVLETALEDNITSQNLTENYRNISLRLDLELPADDLKRFETFVFYFLKRLILIRLDIDQDDTPMVFEIINDRGVKLKPFEILKGKLLGQINKEELSALKLNDKWDTIVNEMNKLYKDEIDNFFKYYLKAKFADSPSDGKKFDEDYHHAIMKIKELDLDHNENNVKKFLMNDFQYYANLYLTLLNKYNTCDKEYIYVYYNYLTDMNTQFQLILSACKLNDPEEKVKIQTISYELDRMFCLLQLQHSYNSNQFSSKIYDISKKLRCCKSEDIHGIFDESILSILQSNQNDNKLNNVFNYGLFKNVGIDLLGKNFVRYFLARIEKFIADNTKMDMRHELYTLVRNTGRINGFHIEHILAENEENFARFKNDDDLFRSERNRLGGLLLMKGPDNISSNNETYSNKLKSYANTLYWNETLREDSYKSKLDFTNWIREEGLDFHPMDSFGPVQVEERQKLLSELIKRIWK